MSTVPYFVSSSKSGPFYSNGCSQNTRKPSFKSRCSSMAKQQKTRIEKRRGEERRREERIFEKAHEKTQAQPAATFSSSPSRGKVIGLG
ncbi:hypothetical protein V6N13_136257 [Hibiscus sabdariffa]|uniref:Uncharacterized protein n=1 Tax=Hibiscus sabdariffa TaxID=183260 RepID=A0ABR2DS63_9ROSI